MKSKFLYWLNDSLFWITKIDKMNKKLYVKRNFNFNTFKQPLQKVTVAIIGIFASAVNWKVAPATIETFN